MQNNFQPFCIVNFNREFSITKIQILQLIPWKNLGRIFVNQINKKTNENTTVHSNLGNSPTNLVKNKFSLLFFTWASGNASTIISLISISPCSNIQIDQNSVQHVSHNIKKDSKLENKITLTLRGTFLSLKSKSEIPLYPIPSHQGRPLRSWST